ncbi:MAG: hypothetical protein E7496_03290 [Ruminococcus sp.]|nr:hypothetical protein [Ruminococcus sp.]
MKKTFAFLASLLMLSSCMNLPVYADDSITSYTDELTLTEAYNKLDALLYSYGIGWREYLAPLDECLEIEHIIYYYPYYQAQACDTVLKLCEENGIDTNLLEFFVLESAEEQETPIETLADELTLTEAYNKLDALLYPDGIGWRTLAPLDECLEMKCIIYYYFYYDTEACDRVRKICEENGIDTSLLMFCALESGEEPETPIETLLEGDADGNGQIDILDVVTLNKAILGKETLSENQLKAIDFNGNGKPDSEESLKLMKYIVGLITSFTE